MRRYEFGSALRRNVSRRSTTSGASKYVAARLSRRSKAGCARNSARSTSSSAVPSLPYQVHPVEPLADHRGRQPFLLDSRGNAVDELLAIARQHARAGQVPFALEDHLERDVIAEPADQRRLRDRDHQLGWRMPGREAQRRPGDDVHERRKGQRHAALMREEEMLESRRRGLDDRRHMAIADADADSGNFGFALGVSALVAGSG